MSKINLNKVIKIVDIEVVVEGEKVVKQFLKFIKSGNDVNDRKLQRQIDSGNTLFWNNREVKTCKELMQEYYDAADDDSFADGIEE